jgi:hypothetical protein
MKQKISEEMDYADAVVIRRTINKGTNIIIEPLKKQNWTGEEFYDYEEKRLNLAGDLMIMSAKGTKAIRLSTIDRKRPTLPKGYTISTGKGTGLRKI